jgi:phenylpyruvate tautomerase
MPYVSIQTNIAIEAQQYSTILKNVSQSVAQMLGKPETYIMVALQSGVPMMFVGLETPAAFITVKSIALAAPKAPEFTRDLSRLLEGLLKVSKERIYIEFEDVNPRLWGWNEKTFG